MYAWSRRIRSLEAGVVDPTVMPDRKSRGRGQGGAAIGLCIRHCPLTRRNVGALCGVARSALNRAESEWVQSWPKQGCPFLTSCIMACQRWSENAGFPTINWLSVPWPVSDKGWAIDQRGFIDRTNAAPMCVAWYYRKPVEVMVAVFAPVAQDQPSTHFDGDVIVICNWSIGCPVHKCYEAVDRPDLCPSRCGYQSGQCVPEDANSAVQKLRPLISRVSLPAVGRHDPVAHQMRKHRKR